MEEMEGYIFVLCISPHVFENRFLRCSEICFIEIEPDEYVSWVEFLDNPCGMSPKSEGTIHDDIWLV